MDNQTLNDLADLIQFDNQIDKTTEDPFYLTVAVGDSTSTKACKQQQQLSIPETYNLDGNKKKRKLTTKATNNTEEKPRTAVRDTVELKKPTEVIYIDKKKDPMQQMIDIAAKNGYFFTGFVKGNEQIIQVSMPLKR